MSEDKAQMFLFYWRVYAPDNAPSPSAEYPFTKDIGRRHRFDFAFVLHKIAVEIDGNAWHVAGGGRHMQDSDLEKYNLAAKLGWRVFRFSPGMLKKNPAGCMELITSALNERMKYGI